jgi:hypothetical protein
MIDPPRRIDKAFPAQIAPRTETDKPDRAGSQSPRFDEIKAGALSSGWSYFLHANRFSLRSKIL